VSIMVLIKRLKLLVNFPEFFAHWKLVQP
jgi:hypothetical protein